MRQNAILAQGPVDIYGKDNPIPAETLAILNKMPPASYNKNCKGDACYQRGKGCKSVSYKCPLKTEYDLEAPFITYRKYRSNRYRKNRGHMIVSGDRYVHCNLTRSYIFHRPPFDWYNSKHADILDDIEEVVPVAGTLGDVHTKDIYATPNFIGNHHVMNLHQNRLNLTDESECEDSCEDYCDNFNHRNAPILKKSCLTTTRPRSVIASRPIRAEDDEGSECGITQRNPQSHRQILTGSRSSKSLEYSDAPRAIKNGNKAAVKRYSKKFDDDLGGEESSSTSEVIRPRPVKTLIKPVKFIKPEKFSKRLEENFDIEENSSVSIRSFSGQKNGGDFGEYVDHDNYQYQNYKHSSDQNLSDYRHYKNGSPNFHEHNISRTKDSKESGVINSSIKGDNFYRNDDNVYKNADVTKADSGFEVKRQSDVKMQIKNSEKPKTTPTSYELKAFNGDRGEEFSRKIPHIEIKSRDRSEPTRTEVSQYNSAINTYIQSNAKMIKHEKTPIIKHHETFLTVDDGETFLKNNISKSKTSDKPVSQMAKDLMNFNISEVSKLGHSGVTYY